MKSRSLPIVGKSGTLIRMVVDRGGNEGLIRSIYPDLRELAGRLLQRERAGHTLQRTALVHEALLHLGMKRFSEVLSAENFLAIAAHQMREILVDYARRRQTRKRGRDFIRVPLFEEECATGRDEDAFLALNEALDRLGAMDARALAVVELRFFQGCTNNETAAILGVSDGTVEADWQFARSWLYGSLRDRNAQSPASMF